MPNKFGPYRSYMLRVSSAKISLRCFFCSFRFLAKDFEKHLLSNHSDVYRNKNSCCWCIGDFTWPAAKKWTAVKHLNGCFKTFLEQNRLADAEEEKNANNADADAPEPPSSDPQPVVALPTFNHLLKTCPEKDFLNRVLPATLDRALLCDDTLFPLTPDMIWWHDLSNHPNKLPIWDTNDDLGIHIVKQTFFIEKHHPTSTIQFFHLMVRASTFPSFVQHMREYGPKAFLLPFSCLCDGGNTIPNNCTTVSHKRVNLNHVRREHLIHRHMILIARNGTDFMDNCWRKVGKNTAETEIVPEDREPMSRPGGPSDDEDESEEEGCNDPNNNNNNNNNNNERRLYRRKFVRIHNWFHMKNAIVYVSNVRSSCSFHSAKKEAIKTFPYMEDEEGDTQQQQDANPGNSGGGGGRRNHHFYIMRSITKYFGCMAALSNPGGILQELTQIFGQRKVENYFQHVVRIYDTTTHCRKYAVKIGNLISPDLINQVMPVAKEYFPTRVTPIADGSYYFYLPRKLFLIFSKDTERSSTMDTREWYRVQAEGGLNQFLNVIAEQYWYPPKHQQRTLNFGFTLKAFYEERMKNHAAAEVQKATEEAQRENEALSAKCDKIERQREELQDYLYELHIDHEREKESLRDSMTAIQEQAIQRENAYEKQIQDQNSEIENKNNEIAALRVKMEQNEKEYQLQIEIKNEVMLDVINRKENYYQLQLRRKENHLNIKNQQIKWKENQIQCKNEEIREKDQQIQIKNEEIISLHRMQGETQQKQIEHYKSEIMKLISLLDKSNLENKAFCETIKKLQQEAHPGLKRKKPNGKEQCININFM